MLFNTEELFLQIVATFSRYTNASYVKRSVLNSNGLLRYDQTQKFIDYCEDFERLRKAKIEVIYHFPIFIYLLSSIIFLFFTFLHFKNDEQRKLYELEANEFQKDVEEFQAQEVCLFAIYSL